MQKKRGDHICTRVENPGEGVRDVFAKIPRGGVKGFGKNCLGGPPILGFIAFLLTSFLKICLGGAVSSPLTPLTPPCVHLWRGRAKRDRQRQKEAENRKRKVKSDRESYR
jgi:hypothetical protein